MPVLERAPMPGDSVAIIDDDPRLAQIIRWAVQDADFIPVVISPNPAGIEALFEQVKSEAVAAICDHRLGKVENISYYGAEAVARLNDGRVPAILVTSFANLDENTSIRRSRAKIPRLLSRQSAADEPEGIAAAFLVAYNEQRGVYVTERRPCRTVVRISRIQQHGSDAIAEVVIPAWNPIEAIGIPAELISEQIKVPYSELANRRLIADVNIYAASAGDIYLTNFEPAPEVPDEWR